MPTIDNETTVVRTESHLSTTLDDEVVLLEPEDGMYYGMNEVGTELWKNLESPKQIAELESMLFSQYDVDDAVVEADIREFIADLIDAGLVEIRE